MKYTAFGEKMWHLASFNAMFATGPSPQAVYFIQTSTRVLSSSYLWIPYNNIKNSLAALIWWTYTQETGTNQWLFFAYWRAIPLNSLTILINAHSYICRYSRFRDIATDIILIRRES